MGALAVSTPALAVENLSLAIGPAQMVDGVGFTVAPGEVMALVGESGCGKSLTAQAVMRLLPPVVRQTGGSIRLGADDISGPAGTPHARFARATAVDDLPGAAGHALDPLSPVGTQIAEALRLPPSQARVQGFAAMLESVGIADPERRMNQYPFELSGGMCQRVMIATALIARPAVLLADEPTTALDVTTQAQILDLLRRLATERDTAVVLITFPRYGRRGGYRRPARRDVCRPDCRNRPHRGHLRRPAPPLHGAAARLHSTVDGRAEIQARGHRGEEYSTPAEFGVGCRFVGRCPLADARCAAETPPLRPVGENRLSACFHAEQVG